jgi:GntR family transcriptional regulator of arabinose operon
MVKGKSRVVNKCELVEKWVREGLRTGRLAVGDMLPSEADLCTRFSIGRNSVRTALTRLAHAGIVETRKGIGTFCRAARGQLSMNVGFVCFHAESYIFPRIVQGCSQVLSRNGYQLLLSQTRYDPQKEREVLLNLRRKRVDGIVIEPYYDGSPASNLDLLKEMDRNDCPVLMIDNHFPGEDFSSIVMDDWAGGELVASHLVDKGHRRVGIVYGAKYPPKLRRRDGALRVLESRGALVPEEWQVGYEGPVDSGALGAHLSALLGGAGPRPTALICTNDEEAIEVVRAAAGVGLRVPEDLSIISFDNSNLAALPRIELTSVDHPGRHIGLLAATILLQRIGNPAETPRTTTLIKPVVVERSSVVDRGASPEGAGRSACGKKASPARRATKGPTAGRAAARSLEPVGGRRRRG